MVSIKIDDLSSVKPFDPHGDPSSVGRRWQRWMKSFSLYADSKGLIIQADKDDNKVQRRALLLHSASEDVQEIFETLADTGRIMTTSSRKQIRHTRTTFSAALSSMTAKLLPNL